MSRRTEELAFAVHLRTRLPKLQSIRDVAEVMESIQTLVGREDGIWWFTELYRRVTVEVDKACKTSFFRYPEWMRVLVIEFAKLYFEALVAWLSGRKKQCPPSWRALFKRRTLVRVRGYSPLQFALAGVNAHIQRDLAYAVDRSLRFTKGNNLTHNDIAADYRRVNRILDRVEVDAMRMMATGWIREMSERIYPWDRRAAMALIHVAREGAFVQARCFALRERAPRSVQGVQWFAEWWSWWWGSVLMLPSYADEL